MWRAAWSPRTVGVKIILIETNLISVSGHETGVEFPNYEF
jgi:hypothetical protein